MRVTSSRPPRGAGFRAVLFVGTSLLNSSLKHWFEMGNTFPFCAFDNILGWSSATVNLPELFDPSLEGRRDLIGLEFQDRTYTFGEIDSRSNRVARWLLHNGFVAGDRLCVYLSNCVEMIDIYLACLKTGVI